MKTDDDLRDILEAEKNKAGGIKKWAMANNVSESAVKNALYRRDMPFPACVAVALGYERTKRIWRTNIIGKILQANNALQYSIPVYPIYALIDGVNYRFDSKNSSPIECISMERK